MNSDEVLVELVKSGNKQAFSALYQKYFDPIYRFCYWQVNSNSELAEDLTQDTFIQVAKSIKSFKGNGSFKNWLYTIAKRVVNKWIKSKYDLPCVPLIFDIAQSDDWIDPDTQQEKIKKVEKLLSSLKPKEKKVITLRYFRNYSVEEVAREMDLGKSNVKVITHRVIKKLRGV